MTSKELGHAVIQKRDILHISAKDLWNRWTTYEGLKTFFGRENKVELKLWGAYEIYFLLDAPEGERGSEGCKVLSFIPHEMLSFTWNAPPHLEARHSGIHTYVVVQFKAISPQETGISIQHLGWPEDERFVPVFAYFEQAWDMVLNNLKKSISEKD